MSDKNGSSFIDQTRQEVFVVKKRGVSRRAAVIALGIVFFVLVLPVCVVYGYYHSMIGKLDYDDGTPEVEGVISETDSEVIADANEMEQVTAGLEQAEIIDAQGEVYSSEDVYNILLIGTDERTKRFSTNARGDSCMLFSVNRQTMEVHLVSFERGMGMRIPSGQYEGQYDWLTHLFRYGGASMMMTALTDAFKVEIDQYVRVNFYTFEQIINAVGGVDITLTEMEALGLNGLVETNAQTRHTVHEGLNHLDGYDALQYARIRYIDSDWYRIGRQRNVIEAVIDKTKGLSLSQLDDLLDTVLPLVRTNLTESDITAMLLTLAPKLDQVTVTQMTIPAKGTYGSMNGMGKRSMFAADFETNARILREALYPESVSQ